MTKSHFDWSDYLSMEENLKLVKKKSESIAKDFYDY